MSNVGADRGNDTFVLTHGRALFVTRPSLRSSVKVNTLRDWHGLVRGPPGIRLHGHAVQQYFREDHDNRRVCQHTPVVPSSIFAADRSSWRPAQAYLDWRAQQE
jgi:hypothetical protein